MSSHQVLNLLYFIDEAHNYLQFLLPLGVYIFLKEVLKIKALLISITSLILFLIAYQIIVFNRLNLVSIESFFIIFFLWLPILIFLIIENRISVKLLFFIESLALFILGFFFITQAVLGGCFIHYIQNHLALKYLRIENWHNLEVFGSEIFPTDLLKVFYFFLGGIVFYLLGVKIFKHKS